MIEFIGYTASVLFSICALPLVYEAIKQKRSNINTLFLFIWLLAELLMTVYVLFKHGLDIPLLLNYSCNIICLLIISKYKFFPKKS
jgi:uncharacterized protein with PQ loop repeat